MAKKNKKTKKQAPVKSVKSSNKSFWKNKDQLLPILGVLLITLLLFSTTFTHDFVYWDDDVNVFENDNLERFDGQSIANIFHPSKGAIIGNYNPLPIFTFAIEKAIFGDSPSVHHIFNVLFHLLAVFLVFRVLLLMNIGVWPAAIGALLFGIHPMRVESVAWITERKDVLLGVFYFASTFYYLKYLKGKRKHRKFLIISMVLFFIGLFAKIQMVLLPLGLLAFDYFYKRPLKLNLIFEKIPYFLGSLAMGLFGIYSLGQAASLDDHTGFGFFDRLLVGAYSFVVYLVKLIVPYEMAPVYPYPSKVLTEYYIAPLGVIAFFAFMWWAFKQKKRAWVFGGAFFFFNIFMMLQILSAGQGYLADRFTYIAYFGFFFVAAFYFDKYFKIPSKRNIALGAAGLFIALYGVLAFNQNSVWKNSDTMWSHVVKVSKETALPYGNRGNYYRDTKQWDKALVDYAKAIELEPNTSGYFNSRGKLYFEKGDFNQAIEDYNKAIAIKDSDGEYYHNRGAALAMRGQVNDAVVDFNRAIELRPQDLSAYEGRSLAYFNTGKFQDAINDYNFILAQKPNDHAFLYERGLSYSRIGKYQEALNDLNKAIRLNSGSGAYYMSRATCYRDMGRKAEARADAQKAQQMGQKVDQNFLNSLN